MTCVIATKNNRSYAYETYFNYICEQLKLYKGAINIVKS